MHFYQRGIDTRESPDICTTTFTFSLSIVRAFQMLGRRNCEEKQTNIFKILRNLFTPTDQNILLILEFADFLFLPVDTTESPCESLRYRNMHFYQRGVDTRESPDICTTTFTFSLSIVRAFQILGVFSWISYHKRAKAIQSPVPD